MKKTIFFILCFIFVQHIFAQIGIGQFRAHFPLRTFYSVAVADDYVYAATHNGLMLLEKSTMDQDQPNLSSWSKVEGLSDIDISRICYDNPSNTLIICYDNGNLDFIKNAQLYNVNDVKNKQIVSSKIVSHIRTENGKCYLVYPFGVVIINLENLLIEDSWFTKQQGVQYIATDFAMTEDEYFITTGNGIFSISRSCNNPANFAEWHLHESTNDQGFKHIIYFGHKLVACKNSSDSNGAVFDTLYQYQNGDWVPTEMAYSQLNAITKSNDEVAFCNWDFVEVMDTNWVRSFLSSWYKENFEEYNDYPRGKEAILDGNDIWVADSEYGLVRNNRTFFFNRIFQANSPYSDNAEGICSHNGIVAVVPGSRKGAAYSPTYQAAGLSWFVNQQWNYNADFRYHIANCHDLTNVVINPRNESEWYIASWGNGLIKYVNHQFAEHYTAANSLLDTTQEGQIFVSGLDYDSKGNLWLTNSQSDKMLKMITPDGQWYEYNIGNGVYASPKGVVCEHLLVDSRNFKWVTFPRDNTLNRYNLVCFSEGNTYDNLGDDQFARVDMNAHAEVSSATVYCIAEDNDGEIWIGTDKGIKVIYYPSNIFKGTAYPRNILMEQDGYVSVLFEFEEITALAVDGGNRKWVGTSKAGVFLISEDGQEELLHFTAEDHPLFSNQITSINIDQQSGEVFFGTAKGLISYRGTSTAGFNSYEDLLVYPNPVRHDYSGPVAINGLKTNSLCKITDANGKLIWQGHSNGGELIWYCKDHFGNRPATGVYYVMASDEEGKEKVVTKFLFIH